MTTIRGPLAFLLFLTMSSEAFAGWCDYRPSQIGGGSGAAAGAAVGAVAGAGAGLKLAGTYTLVHSTSGLTMLGGTWAGASAAGTAGILPGTTAYGWVVGGIMSPAAIATGAVLVAAAGTYESVCYFSDTRITSYDQVSSLLEDISLTADAENFLFSPGVPGKRDGRMFLRDPAAPAVPYNVFNVRNLYVVNGVLMHRDWGRNTKIGTLVPLGR